MKALNCLLAVSVASIAILSPVHAETLTNDTIVLLHNAGIGDEAIVAKIKNSDAQFDTSTTAVIELSGKGISGPVIAAMVEREAAQVAPKTATLSPIRPIP